MAFKPNEFRRVLLRWYHKNGRDLPWRRTTDPYRILVSEFMLQQTQVATVIPYYNQWLRRFPDFVQLARASETDMLLAWQGLGYYARARNLHATAATIVARHGGRVPRSIEQMQQLPGIGKYTAHAVATFAFKRSVPVIEANTARVLARLFDVRQRIDSNSGREILWQRAATLVPKSNARVYNSALVDLGALVCVPREPKCGICPVKKFCRAKNPARLPIGKLRGRTKRITEKHAFVVKRARVLLEQSRHRWRGMWILPATQTCKPGQVPMYTSSFPFTNHRVTLKVYLNQLRAIDRDSQRWIRIDSLESYPIPSPHRRALRRLLSQSLAAQPHRQPS